MAPKSESDYSGVAVLASFFFGVVGFGDQSFHVRVTSLALSVLAVCTYFGFYEAWNTAFRVVLILAILGGGIYLGNEMRVHQAPPPPDLLFQTPYQVRSNGVDSPVMFNWPYSNDGGSTAKGLQVVHRAEWSEGFDRAKEDEIFSKMYAALSGAPTDDLAPGALGDAPIDTPNAPGSSDALDYKNGQEEVYVTYLAHYTDASGKGTTVEHCYLVSARSAMHPCLAHNTTY